MNTTALGWIQAEVHVTLNVGAGTVTIAGAETLTSAGDVLAYFTSVSGGTLINYGSMSIVTSSSATGISTADEPDPSAAFENYGQFSVTDTNTAYLAVGVQYATTTNTGTFNVQSASGAIGTTGGLINAGMFNVQGVTSAYGVNTYNPDSWGGSVRNLAGGTIQVTSQGASYGVVMNNGGEFENYSNITITGQTAYGLYMDRAEAGYSTNYGLVINGGSLIVNSSSGIGIFISGLSDSVPSNQYNIVNSGNITATVAIEFSDTGYSPPQSVVAAINNSGYINGNIILNDNNDRILNTGVIYGNILLGAGNNTTDSSNGVINGSVTFGSGANTFLGGAENDVVYAGSGNNNIDGGGGYNTVTFANFDKSKVTFTNEGGGTWFMDAGGVTDTLRNIQTVHFANGDVSLSAPHRAANDFNGDHYSDLLFSNASTGALSVWTMQGNLHETANAYVNTVDPSYALQGSLDFNGDGLADLVFRSASTGVSSIWAATGTSFTLNSVVGNVDPAWAMAGFGDFNGDGKDDILWRNTANGTFSEWSSTGAGFTPNTYVNGGVGTDWHIQAIGDFDGDGKADILWRNSSGLMSVWGSTGSGFTANTTVIGGVDTTWHVAAVADFNGDGRDDIVFRNDNGAFTEWQSTASGFIPNVYVNTGVDSSWSLVGAFDFNGDGKADLLFRNASSGVIAIWESTGSGFTPNNLVEVSAPSASSLVSHHYDIV